MLIKICIDMLVIGIKIFVGIKIVGFDFVGIEVIGKDIEILFKDLFNIVLVYVEWVVGGCYVYIDIDRYLVVCYGMIIDDVYSIVGLVVGGKVVM